MTLPLVHLVGRQGHGKTTLIEQLVAELTGRGVAVGTIKHSGHRHELDTPGKDSFRHRQAGAEPVAIVTTELIVVYRRRRAEDDLLSQWLAEQYRDCALVLVEGHLEGPGPKVEIWRAAVGTEPIARERPGLIAAVVSDDGEALGEVGVPVWSPRPIVTLADRLLALAGGATG